MANELSMVTEKPRLHKLKVQQNRKVRHYHHHQQKKLLFKLDINDFFLSLFFQFFKIKTFSIDNKSITYP